MDTRCVFISEDTHCVQTAVAGRFASMAGSDIGARHVVALHCAFTGSRKAGAGSAESESLEVNLAAVKSGMILSKYMRGGNSPYPPH